VAIQLAADVAEADFAWTIGSLCQINRIPFDPALLLQKFPAPHSVRQLIEAHRLNLAGVRRLLSVAEVVQRLRPLIAAERRHARAEWQRRIAGEVDELMRILGLEAPRRER